MKKIIYSWEKQNYKPYHWGDQISIAQPVIEYLKKKTEKEKNREILTGVVRKKYISAESRAEMERLQKYYYDKMKKLNRK